MIELSGLDPERDIDIEIVGRRPGEKLREELFNSYERSRPTSAANAAMAPTFVNEFESESASSECVMTPESVGGLQARGPPPRAAP